VMERLRRNRHMAAADRKPEPHACDRRAIEYV